MLIKCPECELQVSDKAMSCPHCGYPLKPDARPAARRKSSKRKRLPNGFGQITEIKGRNLRNPFRAMVSVGKDPVTGRPISKPLKPTAFFSTYNEAYAALVEYHRNPYDLDEYITVKQLYERWSPIHFAKYNSASSIRTITSAWVYCDSVHDIPVRDLRARHIKYCMEEGTHLYRGELKKPSPSSKMRIKSLFNIMLDYAVEFEIVDKNYSRTFNVDDEVTKEIESNRKEHIPYTSKEMKILWDNLYLVDYVDIMLIQAYSGMRPQEIGWIEMDKVNLDEWIITGGMKTDAGIDRIIPIHTKIRSLVENRYKEAVAMDSKYLFNCTDSLDGNPQLSYSKYERRYRKIVDLLELNPEHRPHDGRVHFATLAKKYKVDEYALKYIIGHEIDDITEKVYTKREVSWLKEEIEKIK